MEIFSLLALFVLGLFILVKGANWLVKGAVSLARVFNVSEWVIGVVIVGIGTSIPELAINLASIWNGASDVGLGTIVGSNTFNVLVIVGLSALLMPVAVKREWLSRDLVINLFAILLAALFIIYPIFGDAAFSGITRAEGGVLFLAFLVWLGYMVRHRGDGVHKTHAEKALFSALTSFFLIIIGVIGVFIGGRWVVHGAEALALLMGISPVLVGLVIVGPGTSIPELSVSLAALFKRRTGLAIGNIIGSNIFDFIGILGITALGRPMLVTTDVSWDILAALISLVILVVAVIVGKKKYYVSRREGLLMILAYLVYLLLVLARG